MNAPLTPQSLVEQILQIQQMEHGSLCVIGEGPNGPYFNLNSWENHKNCCRYVPPDKVAAVRQAIEGYHKYQQLTEQYARQVVEKTRGELGIGVRERPRHGPYTPSPRPGPRPAG
jgi:carbamate kinase